MKRRKFMGKHLLAGACLWLGAVIASPVAAATLHAILVGDTDDPKIGVGVETDLNKTMRVMTRVAEAAGLELSEVTIKGGQFRGDNLRRTLSQLRVGSEDVVFLLYSGHGVGKAEKETPWPFLALKNSEGGHDPMDAAQVFGAIGQAKPRLLVAIIDACNNYDEQAVGATNDRDSGVRQAAVTPHVAANLKSLFLGRSGLVIAAAASPNEFADGPVTGGLLVNGFLRELTARSAADNAVDWPEIMDAATRKVERAHPSGRVERQTPFYRIDVAAGARKDLNVIDNPHPGGATAPSPAPRPEAGRSALILHVERRVVVRSAPSGGAGEVRVLSPGEAVAGRLTDAGNNWSRLETSEGWSGYVFGSPFRR